MAKAKSARPEGASDRWGCASFALKRHVGPHGQVIDGGTTEHIFHIGTALDTCHQAEAGRDAAGRVA